MTNNRFSRKLDFLFEVHGSNGHDLLVYTFDGRGETGYEVHSRSGRDVHSRVDETTTSLTGLVEILKQAGATMPPFPFMKG